MYNAEGAYTTTNTTETSALRQMIMMRLMSENVQDEGLLPNTAG